MMDTMVETVGSDSSSNRSKWGICCSKIKFPKQEIVFFTQVILIYVVIIFALVNISLGTQGKVWYLLLTSCLGYMLPNPKIKKNG